MVQGLKKALKRKGATLAVARISGLSHATVSRIARGVTPNPGAMTIKRIETALARLNRNRGTEQ